MITLSKLAPVLKHTLVEENAKYIIIAGSSYKQTITATFGIIFSKNLLPVLVVYGGTTKCSKI